MRNQTGDMDQDMDMGSAGRVMQQEELGAIMDGVEIRKWRLYIMERKRIKGMYLPNQGPKRKDTDVSNP